MNEAREFTRELPVKLNDEELQAYGKQLAEKVNESQLLEEKKKQVTKEWSTRISAVDNEVKRIADARAKGAELRPVKCVESLKGNVVEIIRCDTGEVVDVRPADLHDLQTVIPGTDGVDPYAPPAFDEGDQDMGPANPLPSNVVPFVQPDDESAPLPDAPVGDLHDEEGNVIGEGVESSSGDGVYISSGEQLCPACGTAINEEEKTSMVDGQLIHTACEPDSAQPASDFDDGADLPKPTFSATLGEHAEAKADPAPKKRDRSKAANAKKAKK